MRSCQNVKAVVLKINRALRLKVWEMGKDGKTDCD